MSVDANLFKGTNFSPAYQRAISADISKLQAYFPNIRSQNYPQQPYSRILLQGFTNINYNGTEYPLPINMMLPEEFPSKPPITQLFFPPTIPITQSTYLSADGVVATEKIIPWVPKKTTLPNFVKAITTFFSQYPPYDIRFAPYLTEFLKPFTGQRYSPNSSQSSTPAKSSGPNKTQAFEDAFAQALSIVDQCNTDAKKATETTREYAMTAAFEIQMKNRITKLNNEISTLHVQASKADEIPEYVIPPELEMSCAAKAAEAAMPETLNSLRDDFRSGRINIDAYIGSVRSLRRQHFEDVVFPQCK